MSVTYYISHPIQYFSPLLARLAEDVDLHVCYFSDASLRGGLDRGFGREIKWDLPLMEGYPFSFLKNYSRRKGLNNRFFDVFNPGVINSVVKSGSKIIIVNGWTYSSTLLAILAARLAGKQVWLRAENPLNQELRKSKWVIRLKKLFLKHMLFRFGVSKFLYIGKESKEFFKFYGVKDNRLVYTPYSVDNNKFDEQYRQLRRERTAVRSRLNLPTDKKIILFCGKYIAKKRPMDLLRAFHKMSNPDYALVMAGEGVLRKEMEEYIRQHQLQNVYLTGFINQSVIGSYYAIADVMVMCSGAGETWGLSVNEAMNFAKPVVVSATCGCAPDLVRHGENGFVYPEGDVTALATYLDKLLTNDDLCAFAGNKSKEIIDAYSIEATVVNLCEALALLPGSDVYVAKSA